MKIQMRDRYINLVSEAWCGQLNRQYILHRSRRQAVVQGIQYTRFQPPIVLPKGELTVTFCALLPTIEYCENKAE